MPVISLNPEIVFVIFLPPLLYATAWNTSWPLAFLIGAIVSPPDAVAATSVTKGLGLHPKLIAILEGESLLNEASGLVAYKYALTAIMTGNFVLWQAGLNFLLVVAGGDDEIIRKI